MAIQTDKINYGGDMMIFADGSPLAFSTSAKIDVTLKTRDIGSKDSGVWDEKAASKLSWTASSDALMSDSDLANAIPTVVVTGLLTTTAGNNTITVVGAGFAATDVGRVVKIIAGISAGVDLITTISSYINATQVTLTTAPSMTIAGIASKFVWNVVATTAAMVQGSTTLTMGVSTFVAGDVGKSVTVIGAGANGTDLITTIVSQAGTTAVLATAASTAVVAAANKFVWNAYTTAYSTLYSLMTLKLPIEIVFATAVVSGTTPIQTASYAAGKTRLSGYGYITSLSMNAPDADNGTYSISIEGTGTLNILN